MNTLLLSVFLIALVTLSCGIIVELPNGKVEGITSKTRSNTSFSSFLALRYAKPPVGTLRFELPQALAPWNDTYNATYEKNICYQTVSDVREQSEDCLFLNVFTPKDLTGNVTANLTVLVYIHGGGFAVGAGNKELGRVGPNFFMEYDVVFVAFNYRLGPFGFATTGDSLLPGNLGLKDQTFALQWVQDNIPYFGGDSKKVTIFGTSAGGASVSYQLLNPKSKGLFRAAIMESGTALDPWACQRYQTQITQITAALIDSKLSETDLKGLDIKTASNFYSNNTELHKLLKSVSADKLNKASRQLGASLETANNYQLSKGLFYAPVLEVEHENAFITESQYALFKTGNYNQVPVIVGVCEEEGLLVFTLDNSTTMLNIFKGNDENPATLVPDDMRVEDSNKTSVGQSIKEFYAPNANFSENVVSAIKFHTTHDFHKGAIRQAELQVPFNDVYFYNFNYSGIMGNNVDNRLAGTTNVTHIEELYYYLSARYSDEIPDNTDLSYFPVKDRNVHYRIMTLWTNFAKYLNPTPNKDGVLQNVIWPKVDSKEFKFLEIGEDLQVRSGYPNKYYAFWKDLYGKYAFSPLDEF